MVDPSDISNHTRAGTPRRVLLVTNQWPTDARPHHSPFVKSGVEALRLAGVQVDVFLYIGQWNPFNYLKAIWEFHQKIKRQTYDLVYAHFGQCGLVAISQRKLPVVVHFGGSDLIGWYSKDGKEPRASKLLRTISRLAARRATMVIIPNPNMVAYLPECEYTVIPYGVNLDMFFPTDKLIARKQLGLPEDKKLVLFAADPGRIVKRFELAKAAVDLIRPHLPVDLVVTASVPYDLMPVYMNACDVLVLTSQHEGSPNVVKEALACNLPVVSLDVGDVRSYLDLAPDCAVLTEDDPQAIADALTRVLQQNEIKDLRHLVLEMDLNSIAIKEVQVIESIYKRIS